MTTADPNVPLEEVIERFLAEKPADVHGFLRRFPQHAAELRELLPAIGALVVEEGGPFSHAAIVAREFGCAAVTGAHEATTRIPHGASVEVDPANGTVTVV